MRKTAGAFCLTIVLALVMVTALGLASRAEAQINVNIVVNKNQGTISFTPKYLGVCSNKKGPNCDDNQIRWKLAGALQPGETLTISNAPNHLRCFSSTENLYQVTNDTTKPMPNVAYDSGPPQSACTADEYGTYWPYVVTFTLANGTKIVSDPGGIIHP